MWFENWSFVAKEKRHLVLYSFVRYLLERTDNSSGMIEEHCAWRVVYQHLATRRLHFEVGQPLDPNQGDCWELRFFAMFDEVSQIGSDGEKEMTFSLSLTCVAEMVVLCRLEGK